MEIIENIAALEEEIRIKTEELKALKSSLRLDFSAYRDYQQEKYGGYSLSHVLNAQLRELAVGVATLAEEANKYDGRKHLVSTPKAKVRGLSQTHIFLCNKFLEDLYPIVEKHANHVLGND